MSTISLPITGPYGAVGFDVVDHRKSPPGSWAKLLEEELLVRIVDSVFKNPQGTVEFEVDRDDRQLRSALQDVLVVPHLNLDHVNHIDFNLLKHCNGFELSVETSIIPGEASHHTIIIQKEPKALGSSLVSKLLQANRETEKDSVYRCGYGYAALERQLLLKATRVVCSLTLNYR